MFSQDIYTIHGENTILVASVGPKVREIADRYASERCEAEDSKEFRQFERMVRGNTGIRL